MIAPDILEQTRQILQKAGALTIHGMQGYGLLEEDRVPAQATIDAIVDSEDPVKTAHDLEYGFTVVWLGPYLTNHKTPEPVKDLLQQISTSAEKGLRERCGITG